MIINFSTGLQLNPIRIAMKKRNISEMTSQRSFIMSRVKNTALIRLK